MFHYVRPIKYSVYSEIKGLEVTRFKSQIKFFREKFGYQNVDFLFDYTSKKILNTPVILTFDDGLKDHFKHVYPILKSEKIQGLFFPPAKPILEKIVLDVHKIHFILASKIDKSKIIDEIFEKILYFQKDFELENPSIYWDKLAIPNRFDTGDIIFIKRILQRELPLKVRTAITSYLFEKYVSSNESEFSKELYLSINEINEMRENGMYFSSHSYSHEWLSYLSEQQLDDELQNSMKFCERINPNGKQILCYPYGDFNELVINKAKTLGFLAGLTAQVSDAKLVEKNMFTLSRYDTNDFPQ
jgi:peptidoglycan/xylan/chitin deacetylase (PgdA/CDA1 family)